MSEQEVFDRLRGKLVISDFDRIDMETCLMEGDNYYEYPDYHGIYCFSVCWNNSVELNEDELEDFNELFYDEIRQYAFDQSEQQNIGSRF